MLCYVKQVKNMSSIHVSIVWYILYYTYFLLYEQ